MINTLSKINITHVMMAGLVAALLLFSSAPTLAQNTESAKEGACLATGRTPTQCAQDLRDADTDIGGIVSSIINVLSIIVGAVSVIMIILAGLSYVTSAGDSSKITSAKNTIIYAIVGLVLVIFAQVIVNFVIGEVEGDTAEPAVLESPPEGGGGARPGVQ